MRPGSGNERSGGHDRQAVGLVAGVGTGVWAGAFAASVHLHGLPLDREQVLAWLVTGLAVASVHSPAALRRLVFDWLPLLLALTFYDYSRGVADTLGMPVQGQALADAEQFLFGGTVPTVWLQQRLPQYGDAAAWEVPVTLVYVSHYIVPLTITAWLWSRDRRRWAAWLRRLLALTAGGLATYVLVPAVPPWLAARHGWIDPVRRTAGRGWEPIGLEVADRFVDRGAETVNLVAAMPSLHAGFAALACAFAWSRARRFSRVLLFAYPTAMGFVLVLTGEHYVIDVAAGYVYALAACAAATRWERRHDTGGAPDSVAGLDAEPGRTAAT